MPAPPIAHVVVLMLENRSYDNMLGMLYDPKWHAPYHHPPAGQANLRGLRGDESNPVPHTEPPRSIFVAPAAGDHSWKPPLAATMVPAVDPGEPFADMAQQILGLAGKPHGNPYAAPLELGPYGWMGGFVANYEGRTQNGFVADTRQIMQVMTPKLVPVTSFLAHHYMVCDEWFGSVPSHTFANRLFSVCASSGSWTSILGHEHSYIDDAEYVGLEHFAKRRWNDKPPALFGADMLTMPSLFSQLDAVLGADGPAWKVYFHDYSITANLVGYVHDRFVDASSGNLGQYDLVDYTPETTHLANKSFTTFAQDLAAGTLAPFSLIEPRYSNDFDGAARGTQVNSNHPGVQGYPPFTCGSPWATSIHGEQLLLDVYTKLRQSPLWSQTLLLVVYDENGGCYDHVPPCHTMKPPSPTHPASYVGFDFKTSGPRVPALVISPFAARGSTLRAAGKTPFDHTSIIRTVWDLFDLGRDGGPASLNDRDAAAPSILQGLSDVAINHSGLPRASELEG